MNTAGGVHITPFIDLNEKRGIKLAYKNDFTIGKDGVPVCREGRRMNHDGSGPSKAAGGSAACQWNGRVLYYETVRNMHRKNTGGCTEISLGDFELCDYDRSVMYMVQRIIPGKFWHKGAELKREEEILATYQYDERLGWLLSGVQPYLNE